MFSFFLSFRSDSRQPYRGYNNIHALYPIVIKFNRDVCALHLTNKQNRTSAKEYVDCPVGTMNLTALTMMRRQRGTGQSPLIYETRKAFLNRSKVMFLEIERIRVICWLSVRFRLWFIAMITTFAPCNMFYSSLSFRIALYVERYIDEFIKRGCCLHMAY